MNKFLLVFLSCLFFVNVVPGAAEERLKVVATLSSFADIASSVGGSRVEVVSIASPRFNPHFIEPKPSDVLKLKRADLFLHSGLELEVWISPLVDAAARIELRRGGHRQLDLSQGITLLEIPQRPVTRAEGDIHLLGNPHYWLDPRNGQIIAGTIATKLSELDPAHRATYEKNLRRFVEDLQDKMIEWRKMIAPFRNEKLIGYHNEWLYLMQFTGLRMERFLEPKPGIPPSPSHLASIIEYAKEEQVKALVQSSFYATDAAEKVAAQSGSKVVIIHQNVRETEASTDYRTMLDGNIRALAEALR